MALPFKDLEAFYESLAQAIDQTTPEDRPLFLTRLSLLLANELDDGSKALAAIQVSLDAG